MDKLKHPKVFVIVLNHNGKRTVSRCLTSIYRSDYQNFETIVVDNASRDGSIETVRQNFQTAHVIINQTNLGFAAGNNVAIRFALEKFADYVLLLNNDAYLEPTTLSALVLQAQKDKKVGMINPLILNSEGKTWFEGGKIDWLKMKTFHLRPENEKNSDYLCGCALLISKEVFQKVGLFDEKFFLYYEDTDLSLRTKKAGFSLLVDRGTKIVHDEQSSSAGAQKIYWLVLSGILFFKKHMPSILKPWMYFYLMLRKLKNARDLASGENEVASAVRHAYNDASKL